MESTYAAYFTAIAQKLEFLHSKRCRFKDDTARVHESLFKEMKRGSEFCAEIESAVSQGDWTALHGIFYHLHKIEALPFNRDSYAIMRSVLAALSCGNIGDAKKILPRSYPESKGHYPMYDHAANVLLCIFYGADGSAKYPAEKLVAGAETFAASKKPVYDRMMVASLLAVFQHDAARLSASLAQLCEGVFKTELSESQKMQVREAYGILFLAKRVWTQDEFAKVAYPDCRNFSAGYIEWLFAQGEIPENIGVTYPAPLSELNAVLSLPVAETKLTKNGKSADIDSEAMLNDLLAELKR